MRTPGEQNNIWLLRLDVGWLVYEPNTVLQMRKGCSRNITSKMASTTGLPPPDSLLLLHNFSDACGRLVNYVQSVHQLSSAREEATVLLCEAQYLLVAMDTATNFTDAASRFHKLLADGSMASESTLNTARTALSAAATPMCQTAAFAAALVQFMRNVVETNELIRPSGYRAALQDTFVVLPPEIKSTAEVRSTLSCTHDRRCTYHRV
jgi:hypothetical protein